MKKAVKKEKKPAVKSEFKPTIKIIEPLKIKVVREEREVAIMASREKREITTPVPLRVDVLTKVILPEGFVRCIVTKEHTGMLDVHKVDDIIDIPERRYKSDSFRGLVKKYDGDRQPNKRR
jgi:hypothetical protein